MAADLPLPALLSAAFVACTIEADNEAEAQRAHTTTSFGATGDRQSAWLTSLAMWFNCLGPLAAGCAATGEMTVAELEAVARMPTNLDGMRRWGLVTIDGVGRVPRGSPRPRPTRRSRLALTERGAAAEAGRRPLPGLVERRWRDRFGSDRVDGLRAALLVVAEADGAALPDFLPIGRIGKLAGLDAPPPGAPARSAPARSAPARSALARSADRSLPLVSLLARVLMRYELDWEEGVAGSLVGWCNLLRVIPDDGRVPVRDLPALTGVAKETLAVLTGRLQRAGRVVVEVRPKPARGRQVRLSERGVDAQRAGRRRLDATEAQWRERYGAVVEDLTQRLRELVGDATPTGSPLFAGLEPYPDGWRAAAGWPPATLPWHPMVTHRGGYPDGS